LSHASATPARSPVASDIAMCSACSASARVYCPTSINSRPGVPWIAPSTPGCLPHSSRASAYASRSSATMPRQSAAACSSIQPLFRLPWTFFSFPFAFAGPSPFGGNSLLAGVVKKLGGPAQTRRGGHCSISRHLRRRQTMTSSNKRPETALTAFLLKAPEQSLYALLGLEERDKNRSRALLGEALRRRAHRCRLIRRLENACLLLAVCRRTCVLERKRVLLERIQSASYLGNCLMRFGPRGAFIRRVASIRSLAVVSKRALSHRAFHARVEAARRVESAVDDLQAVTSKTADVSHSRSLTINPFQYALKCLPQAKTPQAPAAPAPDSDDDS
jgi:hypothetical protein